MAHTAVSLRRPAKDRLAGRSKDGTKKEVWLHNTKKTNREGSNLFSQVSSPEIGSSSTPGWPGQNKKLKHRTIHWSGKSLRHLRISKDSVIIIRAKSS